MAAPVVPASTSGVIANLTLLRLDNYNYWSFRVKTYLVAEDLWDVVESTDEAPKKEDGREAEFRTWTKNNAKALYIIQSSCWRATYDFICLSTTAKDAWTILAEKLNKPKSTDPHPPINQDPDKRSLLAAYPKPTDRDAGVEDQLTIEEGRIEGHEEQEEEEAPTDMKTVHAAFAYHVLNDDLSSAMMLHYRYPDLTNETLPNNVTVLQLVISNVKWASQKRISIAKILVELMSADTLDLQSVDGDTAIYSILLFLPQAVDLVECMYKKNENILTSKPPSSVSITATPLLIAQSSEFGEEMALYLYKVTPHQDLSVTHAAQLISDGLKFKRFGIAWDLIQRYPNLAIVKNYDGITPLASLPGIHSAFLSGSRFKFWEKWVYDGIHIKPTPTIEGTYIHVQNLENDDDSNQRHHLIFSVMGLFRELIVMNLLKNLGMFNRIYERKLIHVRILEFLTIMCEEIKDKDPKEQLEGFKEAIFLAIQRGHVEYISHLCRANGILLVSTNKKGNIHMLQFAIECRQEKVYDLVYHLAKRSLTEKVVARMVDNFGNNMLHMVGRFSTLAQLNRIRGAALQMQRELQWFKEVESVVGPAANEAVNDNSMTPRELFTENHKELVKEGEKSMKEIATACTVAGALLVTMMFAAAFTVPGGNNGDTGHPIFLKEKVFTLFIVSDVVSLCSATTSVIMFLGILTSRYAEDDFLKSLPTKMILGLLTLFLAIVTMMISFSCALYILLHGNLFVIIPVVLLSIVPVISYVWMQFPFLVEIFTSTYGAGIFENKVETRP